MTKKMLFIPACFLLLLWPHGAAAQEAQTTKKQELIRELLVATEARNTGVRVMDSMIAEMSRQYPQVIERMADASPELTPAQRQKLKESVGERQARFLKLFGERLKQRIDLGQVMEEISAALYDKYFSEDEIRDLVAFYKTPTGKKTLSVLPQMLATSMQQANEKLTPVVINVVTELVHEETERIKNSQ